ncbi:hypothetical protein L798_12115 [Zootermopsis nevadensis]|uniref:Uncharacterized protein n=1 Tax=Zootermopsis nevadensis TaxID=136037 RepID=A0A067QV50_ZOONE|nr:hypothetical protein L798_12115 [Zootermopsis nevadensis]
MNLTGFELLPVAIFSVTSPQCFACSTTYIHHNTWTLKQWGDRTHHDS